MDFKADDFVEIRADDGFYGPGVVVRSIEWGNRFVVVRVDGELRRFKPHELKVVARDAYYVE